jgi:hypothetical protein
MSRHNFATCLIAGCTALLPLAVRAQQFGAASALYSTGVQAYFGGSSAEAEASFTSLIRVDPNDPRAYYFRALSRIRQGRDSEARSDMEMGAQIEARSPHRFDIGQTLQRVQGSNRLLLEQYRSRAHTVAAMKPPRGPVREPDIAVLRERRIVPLDEFSRNGDPHSVVAPLAPPETVAPPAAKPTIPASVGSAAPAAAHDPFSDDPAAAATPKTQPKAAQPKAPPAKAPLPPAPKPAAPKASDDSMGDPF